MAFETIRYETNGPIAILTLNRPDKLNAINLEMVAEICQAMDQAEGDSEVRVIVLRGAGRAFSAGVDLEADPPRPRAPPADGKGRAGEGAAGV